MKKKIKAPKIVGYNSGGITAAEKPVASKTNFEKRIKAPSLTIKNEDGSVSTHKMMSFESDGKYYAAPTIVEKGGKLVELSPKDAISYALKNKEYKEFKTEKEAQSYAEGGYKKGTPIQKLADGGATRMLAQDTPDDYAATQAQKKRDGKHSFGDVAADYGKYMVSAALSPLGLDKNIDNNYNTNFFNKMDAGYSKNVTPIVKGVLNTAVAAGTAGLINNAVKPNAGQLAGTPPTDNTIPMMPGETPEQYQARLAEMQNNGKAEGGNVNFSTAEAYHKWLAFGHIQKMFEKTPGNQSVSIAGNNHEVQHKADGGGIDPAKILAVNTNTVTPAAATPAPVIQPSLSDAKQYLKNSDYLDNARNVLNETIRKNLKLKAGAPIPDSATLSADDVNKTLKDTPYSDYYKNLNWVNNYYSKYGVTPYDQSGKPISNVAGSNEQGFSLDSTAYGPLHRSIRYSKLAKQPAAMPSTDAIADTGKADGGTIDGAGTAKSDSIKAKVEPNSFVVPAENAHIAEMLRDDFLGGDKKAKLNQPGGAPVKLSDGEHLFSPDEKAYLEKLGVPVERLAPNAKPGPAKADGGPVDTDKLLSDIESLKKTYEDQKAAVKKEQDRIDSLDEADAKKRTLNKALQEKKKNLDKLEQEINTQAGDVKEALTGYKNTPLGSTKRNANVDDLLNKLNSKVDEYKKLSGGPSDQKSSIGVAKSAPAAAAKSVDPNKTKSVAQQATSTNTVKTNGTGASASVKKDAAQSTLEEALKFKPSTADDSTGNDVNIPDNTAASTTKEDPNALAKSLAIPGVTPASTASTGTGKKDDNKKGIGQYATPENILSAGQIIAGAGVLAADGKRPVDSLNADYVSAVEQAKANALYGYDPATKQAYTNNIETARRGVTDLAANYGGADPTRAYAMSRVATNDYAKNMLDLTAADERFKLNKQQYAADMIKGKAGMQRQLFEDKMNAFNVNQQTGAELLNAGIENAIGGSRFNQNKDFYDNLLAKKNEEANTFGASIVNSAQNIK